MFRKVRIFFPQNKQSLSTDFGLAIGHSISPFIYLRREYLLLAQDSSHYTRYTRRATRYKTPKPSDLRHRLLVTCQRGHTPQVAHGARSLYALNVTGLGRTSLIRPTRVFERPGESLELERAKRERRQRDGTGWEPTTHQLF